MCVTIKKIVKFKISLKKTDANSFFFENRFKCGLGCGVEFASKSYSGVRIHAHDFPTKTSSQVVGDPIPRPGWQKMISFGGPKPLKRVLSNAFATIP